MNPDEFREFGKAAVDYIAEYHERIRERPVLPSVEPGYMKYLIPDRMPKDPEQWTDVLKDMDRVIMPGITHWQSPNFHSYYPTATSLPSVVGEMMSAGLGIIGFTWSSSPASTELELMMMDWIAKAMDLPDDFYNSSDGPGGGFLHGSASEATFMALLVAKEKTVRKVRRKYPQQSEQEIKSKLVCYTSDQANCSVEKAGILASVPIRLLASDQNRRLRGQTLKAAIEKDKMEGLIPCYVCATLGTTSTCAFDVLEEIGPVCQQEDIWLHIDAAYAGAALICPELRENMKGIHFADSLVINFNKWMRVNFDCSGMWMKAMSDVEAFMVDAFYLKQKKREEISDLRFSMGRRFRSLKLWFSLRLYGLSGLQDHIRRHVSQAKIIEGKLLEDPNFTLASPTSMGLVCFRFKQNNLSTNELLEVLNARRKIYLSSSSYNNITFLRLVLCSPMTEDDVKTTIAEIKAAANTVTNSSAIKTPRDVKLNEKRMMADDFEVDVTKINKPFDSQCVGIIACDIVNKI